MVQTCKDKREQFDAVFLKNYLFLYSLWYDVLYIVL